MHSATREDINKLANDNQQLRNDISREVREGFIEVKKSIETVENRIDRQFLKIDQRYNWIISIVIATGLTLAGMIVKGFH